MNIIKIISDWISVNPGKAIGIIIGFIFGLLLFTIGIVKTLLIILCIGIGYFIGRSKDENTSLVETISKLFQKKK